MEQNEWPTAAEIISQQAASVKRIEDQLFEAKVGLKNAICFAVIDAGLSQVEASRRAGLHRDTIKRWVAWELKKREQL